MIRLVIIKNKCGGEPSLPAYENLFIDPVSNEKMNRESICAYLALNCFYEKSFGCKLPKIRKNANGRPEFSQKSRYVSDFNLSHTENLCVLAILTDEGKIGVDAECEREIKSAERISERYLNNISCTNNSLHNQLVDFKILFAEFDGISVKFSDTVELEELVLKKEIILSSGEALTLSDGEDFFSRWTLLEALVKADGLGFAAASAASDIERRARSLTLSLKTDEGCYKISLSHLV